MARGSTERVLLVSQLVFSVVGGGRGDATGRFGARRVHRLNGVSRASARARGGAARARHRPRHRGPLRMLPGRQPQKHTRVPHPERDRNVVQVLDKEMVAGPLTPARSRRFKVTREALEEGFKGGVKTPHCFKDQGEDWLSNGPRETGANVHGVRVKISSQASIPV